MKTQYSIQDVARMGGKARAKKLSKKRRREIAMLGVEARKEKLLTGKLASKIGK